MNRTAVSLVAGLAISVAGLTLTSGSRVSAAATSGCGADAGPPAGGPPPGPMPSKVSQGSVPTANFANVSYASKSSAEKLNLFLPSTGKGPFPLIIKIHGGAFKAGDKAMEETAVPSYTAKGYAVASLNYRLSCEAIYPAAVQDVKAAVRFLRANATTYKLDPNRFAAWGESAGANLAAMIGVTGGAQSELDDATLGNAKVSSAVQAVLGWYGPYDFLSMDAQFKASPPAACNGTMQSHDPSDSPESIYSGGPIQTTAAAKKASPISWVATAKKLPPFILAAGDSDCLVPNQQSSTFNDALIRAGAKSSFTLLKGASHGDSAFDTTQTAPALAFLKKVFGK